jgi:hypothetical protein
MRKLQVLVLLIVLLLVTGYLAYQKVTEEYHITYQTTPGYQKYNTTILPKELFFAGERVPLENPAVANRLRQELRTQTYQNPDMGALIARANYWLPIIDTVLKKYNIPEDFKYLAVAESNLINVQSEMAAGGFWQLLPQTARQFGLEVNAEIDERYNTVKSTEAACRYIREAYQYFDSWASVATAYNSGIGYMLYNHQVQKKESVYQLQLNSQTGGYLYRLLAFKQLIEHQKEYGYKVGKDLFWDKPQKEIIIKKSITNLTAFALSEKTDYYTLKMYNPWIKGNTLSIDKKGKTYKLLIPEGKNN